jgi:soluble lytic murein transglycosylase
MKLNIKKLIILVFLINIFISYNYIYSANTDYNLALKYFYNSELDKSLNALKKVHDEPSKYFLQSLIYLNKKKLNYALKNINKYKPPTYALKEYKRYQIFRIYLKANNYKKTEKILSKIESKDKNKYLKIKARLDLAWHYLVQKKLIESGQVGAGLLKYKDKKGIYPLILKFWVEYEVQKRNLDNAMHYYGILLRKFPQEDSDLKIWRKMIESFHYKIEIQDCFQEVGENLEYINNLYKNGFYVRAEKQIKYVQQAYPKFSGISELYKLLGLIYYKQYRYGKAIPFLKNALHFNEYPSKEKEMRYFLGKSYQKMFGEYKSIREFLRIVEHRSEAPYEAEALYEICSYFRIKGPYKKYKKYFEIFQNEYEWSHAFKKYVFEKKWQQMARLEDNQEKIKAFKKILPGRVHRAVAKFYEGEFIYTDSLRNKDAYLWEGIRKFPIDYYVHETLKEILYKNKEKDLRRNIYKFNGDISKYADFYRCGLGEGAIEEINYRIGENESPMLGLIYAKTSLYASIDKPKLAIDTIEHRFDFFDLHYGKFPYRFLKLYYPKKFWGLVSKYSDKYNVKPFLVESIIKKESSFLIKSNSRSGALGLMMVSPEIARDVAYSLGKAWQGEKMLFIPENNIMFGTYYLSWLQQYFKNKMIYMLSGYNVGPNITRKWIGKLSTNHVEEFMGKVKFPEAKEYIYEVKNNYLIYNFLYN